MKPILIIALMAISLSGQAKAEEADKNPAVELTELTEQNLEVFLTADHWAAVRNLSGVAKAIFIIPSGGQAGFVVGAQWGRGLLLVRDVHDWSDPLFIKINSVHLGLLAGAQKVNAVGAVLSEEALDRLYEGKIRASGSADLTLGPGVGGKAGGGAGGVEILMVSSNKGAYFGGSFEGISLRIDEDMNKVAYGDDFSVDKVLANKKGGDFPAAANIQRKLRDAAYISVFGEAPPEQ
ncbi:lipid-binding SYLF domain-containing protein [Paraferrimonas sedimenticola]|uniref:Ysc84 actin-binding domain-containing protein n=1 Tax=Paraferrimonas sedimenticola TaxID=375674 RepID=A0AA37RVG7_9GAMM|nr:lipid-binding SYLF domain-containing protein [Paraferrimonas sedimenticola]GLP95612.1 hypothetical protein GCM10007895_09180 [Paraferrimonas sedimenticola]